MHEAIKKIEVKEDILMVQAHMPLRKYCKTPKDFLNTNMVIDIMKEKYNILETVTESKVSNWPKKGHSRDGVWEFKIEPKKKAVRKASPKQTEEVIDQSVVEQVKEQELPPPKKPTPKRKPAARKQNTGPKRSIRGRMSKIAQDKLGEK